jgi:hypothetical protein
MKKGEWDYEELGSRSEKSIYYTIGLFRWEEKDGEIVRTKASRFIIGFKNDIERIRNKAIEACEKFNKGIPNRKFVIYADPAAKRGRRGDHPLGGRNLHFKSKELFDYLQKNTLR